MGRFFLFKLCHIFFPHSRNGYLGSNALIFSMSGDLEIDLSCTICKQKLLLKIMGDYFDRITKYPVSFQYKHGFPLHNAVITLDKNHTIIKTEFLQLTKSPTPQKKKMPIADYIRTLKIKNEMEFKEALKKIIIELPETYGNSEDAEGKYYEFGSEIAEIYNRSAAGNNEQEIIEKITPIFQSAKIGEITALFGEGKITTFHILNCYENPKFPDGGLCVRRFCEGFFRNLFQRKFDKSYLIKSSWNKKYRSSEFEIECQWSDFAERLKARFAKKAQAM